MRLGLGSSGYYKYWRAPRPRPSHIVDDNDDKQRKSCKLHWGIKRPQVQYQQQKPRWTFSCCKSRCAVPYIGQQQQKIRWENHL